MHITSELNINSLKIIVNSLQDVMVKKFETGNAARVTC